MVTLGSQTGFFQLFNLLASEQPDGTLRRILLPLAPEAIAELLDDLLGTDPSLADLAARIQEHTGGNPFFVEEVVQDLAESGQLLGSKGRYRLAAAVDSLGIPPSVRAVLAARIDRQPDR